MKKAVKLGRPFKPDFLRKGVTITIRLTAQERNAIKDRAAAESVPMSDYIVKRCLGKDAR